MSIISSTNSGTPASGTSGQPALNSTGQFVAFASDSLDLSPLVYGLSNIYLKNTTTGGLTLVSSASIGTLADANSTHPSISGDGRYVVFQSAADNLVPVGTNGVLVNNTDRTTNVSTMASDIFLSISTTLKDPTTLKETTTYATTLLSGSTIGNGESLNAQISTDGKFVAFQSKASNFIIDSNGASTDLNGTYDIYLKNLNKPNAPTLVSSDNNGVQGNHASYEPSLSANGSIVAFSSDADNLLGYAASYVNWKGVTVYPPVDDNMSRDVFVKNITNKGAIELVSVDIFGGSAHGVSDSPSLSADGTKVAFRSTATDLVVNFESSNLLNSVGLYVNDLSANTVTLVNAVTNNNGFHYANGESWNPVISPDGNSVAFISDATNLTSDASFLDNYVADVFVKNLATGRITRIADTDTARGDAVDFAFSGDSLSLAVTRLISSDYASAGLTQVYSTSVSGTSTVDNDSKSGNGVNNTLSTGKGDDTLNGGNGNDRLIGGKGVDELTGGAGNDTFVFKKGDNGPYTDHADTITDLSIGDKIDLSGISKTLNFIQTVATDFHGTGLSLSTTQKDVYVANVDGDNYLVYEVTANNFSFELVAIGSVIPGTLANWTMSAGILTIA